MLSFYCNPGSAPRPKALLQNQVIDCLHYILPFRLEKSPKRDGVGQMNSHMETSTYRLYWPRSQFYKNGRVQPTYFPVFFMFSSFDTKLLGD